MEENPVSYRPRILDAELKQYLKAFGGVLLTGPKMCGKTWTGLNQAASSVYIDDEDNFRRASITPDLVLEGDYPRLVDEWQVVPHLWDKARRIIDRVHRPGLFIFTGSAVPALEKTLHSGVGRFVNLQMRPMSLFESGDSSGAVSLGALFNGEKIKPAASSLDFKKAVHLICRGGWPAGLWVTGEAALSIPRGYLSMIIESDISRVDGVTRSPDKVRLFLRSFARNSATMAGAAVLIKDMREHEEKGNISADSVDSYLNALKQIFIIDEQQAWQPSLRSKTRLRTSPKRHFIDPSLAAAAMDASPEILIRDPKTAGFLFESLCYRDLQIYAAALHGKVYHYRDEKNLEVDAVIQLDDGNWAAVEVKLGDFEFDMAAKHLLELKRKMTEQNDRCIFLLILTATGGAAYTRDDGVHVVPLDCLKP
ncbi:ATPase AAA [Spirochaetia bacterium]|nr:ATPase AAA [Spirochaetia bacterium]